MSSGRSASSGTSGSEEDDEAKEVSAAATPLGLMTSNSVVVCVDVDDEDGMAFLSGAGSGFAGTY